MNDGKIGNDGIALRVAIVDYGDRNEDGEPKLYQHNTRLTEFELARGSDRNMVEFMSREAVANVVDVWRDEFDD